MTRISSPKNVTIFNAIPVQSQIKMAMGPKDSWHLLPLYLAWPSGQLWIFDFVVYAVGACSYTCVVESHAFQKYGIARRDAEE